jgi:carboxyl-terminal processing protease
MSIKKLFTGKFKYVIISLVAIIVLTSASRDERNFSISKGLSIYATLFRELDMFYVDDFEPSELVEKSIKTLLSELDPYTVYYSEKNADDFILLTKNEYGGIGSIISRRNDKLVIAQIYKDTPSYKSKLQVGDEILSIGGVSLKDKDLSKVSDLLKGQAGSPVELVVKRFGEEKPLSYKFNRETIQVPCLPYYGMIDDKTAYISLAKFTVNAAKEMRKAIINLKTEGASSLVLDLRNNPGGLIGQAVEITNFFVARDELIVSTKGRIERMNYTYTAKNNPILAEMPVIVLINRSSASASEIVAGAIQDLDRGLVMGQRSFGKGLVQTTRELVYNSKLKLTTAKYYTPSGRCVQAIDYSHRNEDGSVGHVPDSLISEFTTKNGRKVYDGGGISPDIKIKARNYNTVTKMLVIKNSVFDFATEYLSTHKITDDASIYTVDDQCYQAFIEYLKRIDFKYDSASELMLKNLKEVAEQEKYYNLAQAEFDALKAKLSHSFDRDLDIAKSEIKKFIAIEFMQRTQYQEGSIKYQIKNDALIDSALIVLKDMKRYNEILKK